jgi:flavin reductase (DIM6/NTAB) family NADH-FMN oxidoreductase RutF
MPGAAACIMHAVTSVGPSHKSSHGRAAATKSPFSDRHFRDALAQFATGVTIVCTRTASGRYIGFTVNSFSSVSLDPPLILWTIARASSSLTAFETAERYAVNVLAADQAELARRFSRPHADRFAGVTHRLGWSDAPLIEGCVAWLECRHHARHVAGDHILFIGEVVTVEHARGVGLVFHQGRFASAMPLTETGKS